MKLRKTEVAALLIALLLVVFTVGYFVGRGSVEGTVVIDTESGMAPVQSATPVITGTADAEPSQTTQGGQVPASSGRVNINTATAEELEALPGIGEVLAQRIITYREENGPFPSTSEIMEVKGIGYGIYGEIADQITVD